MSFLNVHIAADGGRSALVGVDTEAVSTAGTVMAQASKLAVLPHYPAVIAIRGVMGLLPLIYMACVTSGSDLDGLLEELPACFPDVLRHLDEWKERGILTADAPIEAISFAIVGWSAKQNRMIARLFEQTDRATGFVGTEIPKWYIAPGTEALAKLPPASSRNAMVTLARAQIRCLEEIAPQSAGGGELIIATLTEREVRIERCGRLVRLRAGVNTQEREPAAQSVQTIFSSAAVVLGDAAA